MAIRAALLVLVGTVVVSPAWGRPAPAPLPPPPPPVTISVEILAGDGRVASVPAGIDCPTTCSADFFPGATVKLTALPGPGATLYGWGGACAGVQAVCRLVAQNDTDVTATFDPARLTVTAEGPGGWVTSAGVNSPAGIDCGVGSTCTATFPVGTAVTLFGIRTPEGALDDWVGCVDTDGSVCKLTLTSDLTIVAKFSVFALQIPVNIETDLNLAPGGGGGGEIAITPPGAECAAACKKRYPVGVVVRFVAKPDADSTFGGWGGACAGASGPTCSLGVVPGLTVAATFDRKPADGGGGDDGSGDEGGGGGGDGNDGNDGSDGDQVKPEVTKIATRVTARVVRGPRGRRIQIVVTAARRASAAIRVRGPRAATLRRSALMRSGRNVISIPLGPRRPRGRQRVVIVLRDATGYAETIARTVTLR